MQLQKLKYSFTAVFMAVAVVSPIAALAQPVQLITYTNTVWKYRANTSDPGYVPADAWTAAAFDDSGWPSGQGLFGYESTANLYAAVGDFHTYIVPPNGVASGSPIFPGQAGSPLSPGPSGPASGGPSAYFRTHFTWNGTTDEVLFSITNAVDDGIIVYLNGQIVMNFNVPTTPSPMTWDINTLPGGANPAPFGEPSVFPTNNVPATGLVVGDNVLAVELHQQANTSSDDIFAMSLWAVRPLAPTNLAPNLPTNIVLLQNRSTTLAVQVAASPPPLFQWFVNNTPIPDATNATLFLTNELAVTSISNFFVRASNSRGTIFSRTNTVTFTADQVPPTLVGASPSASFTTLVVTFSEPIDSVSAVDVFNYELADGGGGFVNVNMARPIADGASVLLTTDPQAPGTTYTLTVMGISDLANNTMVPQQVTVRTWVTSNALGATWEVYNGTLGSLVAGQITNVPSIAIFTNHPTYVANTPSECGTMAVFNSRQFYTDDTHEQYGGRLQGLFIPPITGMWRLFIRSDDPSELWFNANGPGASGAALVARETGCCAAYLEPGVQQTSAAFPLTAGRGYYIRAIWKEITGGDYCEVAARLEGDPTPAASLTALPSDWIGYGAAPENVGGTFNITQQPASVSVVPGTRVTFRVGTDTTTPLYYQWRRNGVDIPGATCATYSLDVTPADGGARFSVLVSIIGGGSKESSEATLNTGVALTAVRIAPNQYQFTWTDPAYQLQQAPTVTGAWNTVPGAVSGFTLTIPATGNGFLRLIKP